MLDPKMMYQANKDFELCRQFGVADQIRALCAGWPIEHIQEAHDAFETYQRIGVMSLIPFRHFRIWATFTSANKNTAQDDVTWQVVIDTLFSMAAERGQA
jgi:hypothetical protein